MKLFLSSAGIKPETRDAFLELIGKDPKKMTVAFIPTACDPEPDKSYVQWTVDQIEEVGLKSFTVDLKGESEATLKEKLGKADIICVNGGNTFYLLDWVKKSGFDKVIRPLLNEGKIYFGISAGSYIACPTIEASKWKRSSDPDVIGNNDLRALALVNFLVLAHYKEKHKEDVKRGASSTNYPVAALTDQQAVVVSDNEIKIVGTGMKYMLNGFKEI